MIEIRVNEEAIKKQCIKAITIAITLYEAVEDAIRNYLIDDTLSF